MRYFIYFICVIVITMIMVYIGTIKEGNLAAGLTNKLCTKCSEKVLKYLNKNEYASLNDVQNLIKGVSTSVFWSRKRVQVENPLQFSRIVTDKLYKEGKISIQMRKNEQVFTLKQNPQKA
ncbi:hypothetical protein [Haloimpatiens lingqiaonensis]|uniref:hypothetical protein n=1 Tax=Haloimpatiens lingqiaonensis TaxID=1380675 RepID=UPI0010FE6E5E|nr:hypothetical protein [Haloimpatiens lingqiaonensis]